MKDNNVKEENTSKKKSNKKILKILIPIALIVAALLSFLIVKLTDKGTPVQVFDVKKGTVKQYYDTTGTLESGAAHKYYIYDGVKVKEVNVSNGSQVKAGDILATFDTSSMDAVIKEKYNSYIKARQTYNESVASQNDTAASIAKIDEQIAALQAQKQSAENQTDASASQVTIPSNAQDASAVASAIASGAAAANPSANIDAQIQLLQSEKSMLENGQSESIVKAYKTAMDAAKADYDAAVEEKKDMDNGWIAEADGKVSQLNIKAGEVYQYQSESSSNQDLMSALASALSNGENISADSLVQGLSLANGNNMGTPKGVGMVVDSYSGYKVEFSLGKYDVQTIALDMPAIITYTDYKYKGAVTYISAIAEGSSSPLSSMLGGSSGSNSSNTGVKAEVTITNPDSKLILGFDAKISILTSEVKDALIIPVESLVIEDGNKFVYVYDETSHTAKKVKIETGISSDKFYEVKSGLKVGQKVIVNASKVNDGMKVYVGE